MPYLLLLLLPTVSVVFLFQPICSPLLVAELAQPIPAQPSPRIRKVPRLPLQFLWKYQFGLLASYLDRFAMLVECVVKNPKHKIKTPLSLFVSVVLQNQIKSIHPSRQWHHRHHLSFES